MSQEPARSDARRRRLPALVRIPLIAVVVLAVLVLLFTVVFPRVEMLLEDPTLGSWGPAATTSTP